MHFENPLLMNKPGACIFDLDGVIVETTKFHYMAWKRLAGILGIPFNEKDNESLKGVSRRESLQKILALADRKVSETEFQQLMERKNRWYNEYISSLGPVDILEGVPEFLEQCRNMEIKLAIGSSSKNARQIMDYLKLNAAFDAVVDGTKIEKTKPDPEIFLKAADAVDTPPAGCIVFEDAASGIQAARAAGMTCIGVGSEQILGEADLVISTFKGLTPQKLFAQLNP